MYSWSIESTSEIILFIDARACVYVIKQRNLKFKIFVSFLLILLYHFILPCFTFNVKRLFDLQMSLWKINFVTVQKRVFILLSNFPEGVRKRKR